tara:strand:+ start:685 stop:951 length:267 start_codon:yes stop_codon:yes gene_type:complete
MSILFLNNNEIRREGDRERETGRAEGKGYRSKPNFIYVSTYLYSLKPRDGLMDTRDEYDTSQLKATIQTRSQRLIVLFTAPSILIGRV